MLKKGLESELNKALTARKTQGRPEDHNMMHWFEMLCEWLELVADSEPYTLTELQLS